MTRAYASTVLDADIDPVWAILRDFGRIGDYYPITELVELDHPSDTVGCVRTARHRQTGQVFREQLVALSDAEHSMSYTQLDMPEIANCLITARLRPVTVPSGTFIEWCCDLDVLEGDPAAFVTFLERDVYEPCFAGLQALLAH